MNEMKFKEGDRVKAIDNKSIIKIFIGKIGTVVSCDSCGALVKVDGEIINPHNPDNIFNFQHSALMKINYNGSGLCPICGASAFVLFNMIECCNPICERYRRRENG